MPGVELTRMRFFASVGLLSLLFAFATGCHTKQYTHINSEYKISINYPGNVDLFDDREKLLEESGRKEANREAVDRPQLLFALVTMRHGQLTCSVHQLPESLRPSADEYYEASTAKELAALGAEIVEPKTEVELDGKSFITVGFKLMAGNQPVRSRIYEYLEPESGRVLVLTASATESSWASEIQVMEAMLKSLKVDW